MERLLRVELLIAIIILGYIVGLPVLIITLSDGRTLSRRVWAAVGRRRSRWEQQLFLAYVLAGWPVLLLAASWRNGRLRHELRRERALERERGRY